MAWLEQRGEMFRIGFRFRGEKFRVNLKATEAKEANGCLARLEENLRLVERGRLDVPPGADLGLFLISDGKLEKPVELVRAVRLSELFQIYQTEFTVGAKEVITRAMEDIHMKHVSRIIGGQTLLATVTAGTVQRFVDERSREQFNGYRRGSQLFQSDLIETGCAKKPSHPVASVHDFRERIQVADSQSNETVLDRNALYYPNIHIENIRWLKATLLCFPQVSRIVPNGFSLEDSAEVLAFRTTKGPRNEPLLAEEDPHQFPVYQAQQRLIEYIKENERDIARKYSKSRTAKALKVRSNDFTIHRGKMGELLEHLRKFNLAWPAKDDGKVSLSASKPATVERPKTSQGFEGT